MAERCADVSAALVQAHRQGWASVVAAVARSVRDLDLAEEAAQEAFATAAARWPADGIPDSPTGWLVTVARRRTRSTARRRAGLTRRLPLLVVPDVAEDELALSDERLDREAGREAEAVFSTDRLRLLFMCCHPSLARESQVALTARLVCGLTTQEAARVLLVPEPTMAARITRAKKKITAASIPFRVPTGAELPDRLDVVLDVVFLLLTAGHLAPVGDGVVRDDLLERALDLTRSLVDLMPDESEVLALHALALLTWARREGRRAPDGRLLLLEEQDRTCWDREAIAEADGTLRRALRRGPPRRMALQAAIAACHATAPTYAETDWAQIVGLYDVLLSVWPTPVVALNRAVAVAMVAGPRAGLEALDDVAEDGDLRGYPYLPAVRGRLLAELGDGEAARREFEQALALTVNEQERHFLRSRLSAL